MKILITNSPLHYTHGHTFTQADWQTLVLPTLAGIVGPEHDIRIVDNMDGVLRSNRIMENVRGFNPDIVMFSIIAGRDIHNTISVIRAVHLAYPKTLLFAGGQGASFYDAELLHAGINVVVRGEGETTIPELLWKGATESVAGISYLDGQTIKRTSDRTRIKSLDDSPFPRWDLMPLRKSLWFKGRFTGSVETSRGCPFTCNFCAVTSFWEASFRVKSPERIVEEMEILSRSGRTHLYMADDNFGMGTKHHVALFELMIKRKLDVRFFAQMRTDTVGKHPDLMALAARAGQYGALIGFDTYDPATFHHIEKIGSIELNRKCAEVLRKNKIMIYGSHIYGLPNQKHPMEFWPTFTQGRKNSDLFRMPHFSLLPGTKLYDDTITEEAIAGAADKSDFRMLIRNAKERRMFQRWYVFLNLLHVLLPDEWLKMLFHSNPAVRTVKWRGYIGIMRHWFYKRARAFGVTDI